MTFRIAATYLPPLVLAAFICCVSCCGCVGGMEGIETQEVLKQPLSITVTGNGRIEACGPFYVYPRANAPIAALNVRDGDRVEAGQVLASLDTSSLYKVFKEAESNYLTQSSMGDLFEAIFHDLESLYGAVNASLDVAEYYRSSMIASAQRYDDDMSSLLPQLPPEIQAVIEEIRSRVRSERDLLALEAPSLPRVSSSGYPPSASAADAARSELAYSVYVEAAEDLANPEIIAPVSGSVFFVPGGGLVPEDLITDAMSSDMGGLTTSMNFLAGGVEGMVEDMVFDIVLPELEIGVGSFVKERSPVFMIVDLDHLLLRLKVEELDIGFVQEGQKADVYLDALPRRALSGRVSHVASRSSLSLSGTPLFEVEVDVEAAGECLKLGYSAFADIHVVEEEAMVIPLESVLMEPSPRVFVVEDGIAHEREVVLGVEIEDRVEILDGLREGEVIVVKGTRKMSEGCRI